MNRLTQLAAAAAASLSLAAPAQADNDAAKVIAGVIGIALLGAVISDLSDDNRHAPAPAPAPTTGRYHHTQPKPLPKHFLRYTLPKSCVQTSGHSHGKNALLSKSCLNRNFAFAGALPQSCEVRYWNHKRSDIRKGYTLNCLERHGYRVARH